MYYAVKSGKVPGIYNSWGECETQVKGFSGAQYKKFQTEYEASEYINGCLPSKTSDATGLNKPIVGDDEIEAYVDGSFEGTLNSGGYAAVLVRNGEELGCISGKCSKPTKFRNIGGELEAAERAIVFAVRNNYKKITIYHDYTGIAFWANEEWTAKSDVARQYVDYIKRARTKIDIDFVKVEAHTGNQFNELADFLANTSLYLDKGETITLKNKS